ncbi:hypothetical protein GGS26DRAFT_559316 [Hypomontagnella submonticulosa]|nr:hypothetical protein GGS26DRAFT_559316 [Hypomontagnella submonticulosa]
MSSITTTIPTGPINKWCLGPRSSGDGQRFQCANETRGTQESDFQTFCCNGKILDSARDLSTIGTNHTLHLADMICCGVSGPQAGGLDPSATQHTACIQGSPTPLASLAGTNTDNAVDFVVTYTSVSWDGTVGDFSPTEAPSCFWVYKVDAEMEEITLPAPEFTTPPPASTKLVGTESTVSTTTLSETGPPSVTETPSTPTTTPSGAVSTHKVIPKIYICFWLGFVATNLLWS